MNNLFNQMILKVKKILFSKNISNSLLSILASIIYNFGQFILIVICAKLKGSEAVGIVSYSFSLTAPIFMLFELRLQFVYMADAANNYTFKDYLTLRVFGVILSLGTVILILIFLKEETIIFFCALFISFSKVFESLGDIYLSYGQKRHVLKYYLMSRICRGFLGASVFFLIFYSTDNIIYSFFSLSFSSLLIFFLLERKVPYFISFSKIISHVTESNSLFNSYSIKFNIWELFKKTFSLGGVSCLISLSTNIPRYFLKSYSGFLEVGIYSIVSYAATVNILIMNSFFHPLIPALSQKYANGNIDLFKKDFFGFIKIGFVYSFIVILLSYLLGNSAISFCFGSQFLSSKVFLMLMMVSSCLNFLSLFILYGLTAAGFLRLQFLFYLANVSLMLTLCYIFIPQEGLIGASISYCITYVLYIIFLSIYFYRKLQINSFSSSQKTSN